MMGGQARKNGGRSARGLVVPGMLFLCGIAGCSMENMRRGLYEGFRQRPLQSSMEERTPSNEAPDFAQYERMRKERGWSEGSAAPPDDVQHAPKRQGAVPSIPGTAEGVSRD